MKATFKAQLTAEVVRELEGDQPLPEHGPIEAELASSDLPVARKIMLRAQRLSRQHHLDVHIDKALRNSGLATLAIGALFVALGALAASQAFSQVTANTVNFYWLLTVLLGFNLLALLFWVIGLTLAKLSGSHITSPLPRLQDLVNRWLSSGSAAQQAYRAVHGVLWSGDSGHWLLSRMTHAIWLSYLTGGLAMILLMLATRQFDFVWETTLLGPDTFVSLTETLSIIPAALGFSVPDSAQVAASHPGIMREGDAGASRRAWAGLLLGCMVVYGILPRLLLLGVSQALLVRARGRFRLPLSDPYYIGLRNRLMPATRRFGVVDPDRHQRPAVVPVNPIATDSRLPDNAFFTGIELNPDQPWPPGGIPAGDDLGIVNDGPSQHRVLDALATSGGRPLVAVVPLMRSPDRGLERLLGALKARSRGPLYLALSEADTDGRSVDTNGRERDWFRLAAGLGIGADSIIRLRYRPRAGDTSPHAGPSPGVQGHD